MSIKLEIGDLSLLGKHLVISNSYLKISRNSTSLEAISTDSKFKVCEHTLEIQKIYIFCKYQLNIIPCVQNHVLYSLSSQSQLQNVLSLTIHAYHTWFGNASNLNTFHINSFSQQLIIGNLIGNLVAEVNSMRLNRD